MQISASRIILPLNDDYSADREVDNASATGTAETAKVATTETTQETSPETSSETSPETSPENLLNGMSKGARSVFEMIKIDDRMTAQAMADRIGVSKRMVLNYTKELASIGLRHEGPTKKGRWVFDGEKVKNGKS